MKDSTSLIALEALLDNNMQQFKGQSIMTIEFVASVYEVKPNYLQQRINKNLERFPNDFMICISKKEQAILKTAFPNVLTEGGILMTGGILNSKKAIKIHIQVINRFVNLYRENINIPIENDETTSIFNVIKQLIQD